MFFRALSGSHMHSIINYVWQLSKGPLTCLTQVPQCESCRFRPPRQTPLTHEIQKSETNTRDPLQPSDATPSCAARAQDVQNAKDHRLALSTAKMAPAERCDLCTQRHEKACSVACVDRSRARSERLLGRRALVQVAPEDKDADSRKQCSKAFT